MTTLINCKLCGEVIARYWMDIGDTVILEHKNRQICICDDCARDIAKQLIER